MSEVIPTIDAAGERDYGKVDSIEEIATGEFEIAGEFGTVRILSQGVRIEMP